MECRFTVAGRRLVGTREQVETALRDVRPEPVRVHSVEIGARIYPVRQAMQVAFGLDRIDCFPQVGRRVFSQLGFRVSEGPNRPKPSGRVARLGEALPHRRGGIGPEIDEWLDLPPIMLGWYPWERWEDIEQYGGSILDRWLAQPGVYEARLQGSEERLTIGKATNLRKRILQGLIKGKSAHPSGRKIREHEDLSQVRVRWALTDRPAAAEEELHRRHIATFGHLPTYTSRT